MKGYENKMITTIYAHEIEYSWEDGEVRQLDESDVNHIKSLLKDDYRAGEFFQYDSVAEKAYVGWWKINKVNFSL